MLGDVLDNMVFGTGIKAHGKEWFLIKTLSKGMALAAPANSKLPCQVYLVHTDKEEKPIGEEKPR